MDEFESPIAPCIACGEPAECACPLDDGAVPACWRCAHAIAEHGAPVTVAARLTCACAAADVFPMEPAPPLIAPLGN